MNKLINVKLDNLLSEIDKCGINLDELAEAVGISEDELKNRIEGKEEFLLYETSRVSKYITKKGGNGSLDFLFKELIEEADLILSR